MTNIAPSKEAQAVIVAEHFERMCRAVSTVDADVTHSQRLRMRFRAMEEQRIKETIGMAPRVDCA